MILLQFSKYIALSILSEWLALGEFVELDSSLCSQKQRRNFLELVAQSHILFERAFFKDLTLPLLPSLIEWLSVRHLELFSISKWRVSDVYLNHWRKEVNHDCLLLLGGCLDSVLIERVHTSVDACCTVLSQLKSLRHLELSQNKETGRILSSLTSERVVSMALSHCTISCNYSSLFERHAALEHLAVLNCEGLYPDDLRVLKQLKSITFGGVFPFKARELHSQCTSGLQRFAAWPADAAILRLLATRCADSLTALDVRSSDNVSGGLMELVVACRSLTEINVSNCKHLKDEVVRCMAQHLPDLRRVNLGLLKHLKDETLTELLTKCPLLEEVHVSNSNWLTTESLQHAALCAHLRVLDVADIKLTSAVLADILRGCRKLCRLSMGGYQLPAEALYGLHDRGSQLTQLSLTGASAVTDGELLALFPHCPNLTCVKVISSPHVTWQSVLALFKSSQRLHKLAFCYCNLQLSRETVEEVVTASPRSLRILELLGVVKENLRELVEGLTQLRLIKLAPTIIKRLNLGRLHSHLVVEPTV